jgi:pyruvate kinase
MRAISVYTESGTTARLISKYRPKCSIFAFASEPRICNRINMLWGVRPVSCGHVPSTEDMVRKAEQDLLRINAVQPGDVMGIVAGTQKASGSTNFMRLHVVGVIEEPRDRRKTPRAKPAAERRKK